MASPRPVLRMSLTALLWSQRQNEQARASLRQAIHELQDCLGPHWDHLLHAQRHHLTLHGAGLVIDTVHAGSPSPSEAEVLHQLRNPLLEDLSGLDPAFDRWLVDERARINRTGFARGEWLLSEQKDTAAASAFAEELLAIEPGHEGVWRTLIRRHLDAGDRRSARQAADRFKTARAAMGLTVFSPETENLLAHLSQPDSDAHAPDDPTMPPRGGTRASSVQSATRLGVLPLRLIDPSHPAHNDGLALGLAEELTTALSRFRWLSCVPSNSVAAIAGDTAAAARPWHGVDADFMLDGSVQRGASKVRLLMRVIDARSRGEVVWARRFDREGGDTLMLQDDLAAEIVAQIEPELLMRVGGIGAGHGTPARTAHELVLTAIPAIYGLEQEGYQNAGKMLEEALTIDPHHASAHAWYAYWHVFLVGQGWADDPDAATRRARQLADRAVTLDPGDARALTLAGHVRGFLDKRPREAMALHDRAIALNPNLAMAWGYAGITLSYLGQHEDALIRVRQAIRISPSEPHSFFFDAAMVMAHLLLGEHERAVEFGRRAIELNPGFSSAHKLYLSALGHLGRTSEATKVRTKLLALEPSFTTADAIARSPLTVAKDLEHFAEGLRKAGLR